MAFAPFGTTAQSPPCIMLYLAIANLSWAIVWVTIFFFTPEGGIHRAPASDLAVLLYEAYHWASAAILLCFYFGTVRRYFPTVRLTTYEAKKFLSVGMIASVANVLINILSSTFGPSRSVRLFIACAIQNTLMYNGLVLAVLIYDRWNMNAEVRPTASFDRACLSALVVSKAITITTLFAIGVTYTLSEDHPMIVGGSSTPLTITLVNFNRAFLIYFGLLKMIYLARKLKRPNVSVFAHSSSFEYITKGQQLRESMVSTRLSASSPGATAAMLGAREELRVVDVESSRLFPLLHFICDRSPLRVREAGVVGVAPSETPALR